MKIRGRTCAFLLFAAGYEPNHSLISYVSSQMNVLLAQDENNEHRIP